MTYKLKYKGKITTQWYEPPKKESEEYGLVDVRAYNEKGSGPWQLAIFAPNRRAHNEIFGTRKDAEKAARIWLGKQSKKGRR